LIDLAVLALLFFVPEASLDVPEDFSESSARNALENIVKVDTVPNPGQRQYNFPFRL